MVVDLGLERDEWCIADVGVFRWLRRERRKETKKKEEENDF
jgi:hypothetical protein